MYLLKRLGMTLLVLVSISIIVFLSLSFMPGDPARIILGPGATEEAVNVVRKELGLDDPLPQRYLRYISGVIQGDFGESYDGKEPVSMAIMRSLPITLRLAITATTLAAFFGLVLGVTSAVRQYSAFDNIVVFTTTIAASVPPFLIAFVLVFLFAINLKWLPTSGLRTWHGYILPVISLTIGGLSAITRLTRAFMLEVLNSDYARTARAKGASEARVIFKHVLKNAIIPLLVQLGMMLGALMGGAVVIERIFAIPGLGSLVIQGLNAKNAPVVMGCILLMSFFSCFINLSVDIINSFVDPRIRSEFTRR